MFVKLDRHNIAGSGDCLNTQNAHSAIGDGHGQSEMGFVTGRFAALALIPSLAPKTPP